MTESPYASQIEHAALRNNLPVPLVRSVVQVESSFSPWAGRYEHGFFTTYVRDKPVVVNPPCPEETERRWRACSWGLMQIMGQTARELGFRGVFLSELCDVDIGLEFGCRYLNKQALRYRERYGWEGVVAAYNAGSVKTNGPGFVNQRYVEKIRKAGGFV